MNIVLLAKCNLTYGFIMFSYSEYGTIRKVVESLSVRGVRKPAERLLKTLRGFLLSPHINFENHQPAISIFIQIVRF